MISFMENKNIKKKPDWHNLGFGKYFSDYMFTMDYLEDKGWHNATISPYTHLSLSPASMVFHYGQSVFEGMKAYKNKKGEILLFRPQENIKRLNLSCERLCMPQLPEDLVLEGLTKLLKIESSWIPNIEGTALYIRPFVISTQEGLGVSAASSYKFIIILSPVGAYYGNNLNPVKIFVEPYYVRAVVGGLGEAKASANYAASIKAQQNAKKLGYSQVLWLDAIHKKYIEEVGTMNIFFKIKNTIVTPSLTGSILSGVTRKSVIDLCKDLGFSVVERQISIDELVECGKNGTLEESFGSGTAAVISPISEFMWKDEKILVKDSSTSPVAMKLYEILTGIQTGKVEDKHNWTYVIK